MVSDLRSRICLGLTACLLSACGVPRPDTDICVVNVPGRHLTCYNMKRDYDQNGNLLPGHAATFKPLPATLNKFIVVSPGDFGRLKAYLGQLREEQNNCH